MAENERNLALKVERKKMEEEREVRENKERMKVLFDYHDTLRER